MKLEQRALLIHILVNILLIIAKVIIGVFFHVYLLVVDAIYTGSDFLFNILTWIGIKIGNKKASKKCLKIDKLKKKIKTFLSKEK